MKIGLVSLGCPKNLVDGEVMLGLASQAGHEITADASSADVIVVNTCAFIDRAKEESVDAILEMAQLKRDGAGKRLVVTGCLAERYRDELKAEIPEIDAVLGTGEVPEIVDAIGECDGRRVRGSIGGGTRASDDCSGPADLASPRRAERDPAALRAPRTPRPPAHVSLRRVDAARHHHAAALRLRQGGGGLRLHVRVLHHPDAARQRIAAASEDSIVARGRSARGPRRARTAPDLAGHDVLRHRSRRARRPRAAAAPAERASPA